MHSNFHVWLVYFAFWWKHGKQVQFIGTQNSSLHKNATHSAQNGSYKFYETAHGCALAYGCTILKWKIRRLLRSIDKHITHRQTDIYIELLFIFARPNIKWNRWKFKTNNIWKMIVNIIIDGNIMRIHTQVGWEELKRYRRHFLNSLEILRNESTSTSTSGHGKCWLCEGSIRVCVIWNVVKWEKFHDAIKWIVKF